MVIQVIQIRKDHFLIILVNKISQIYFTILVIHTFIYDI